MAFMLIDADAAYQAFCARDARFDGRVFVGVTSTGVYCRPVCRVRVPLRKNCRFFDTRAKAEAAAFRPCMKCRPEIAPGLSLMDSSRTLADTAAQLIEQAVHSGQAQSLPTIAAKLGVTDRHLRRIFSDAHGVAPLAYLTTQRLLLAQQLLTDTPLPVTQVALASGFASLRRFNAAFLQRYRFNPSRLRREGAAPGTEQGLVLAYRPPYDVAGVIGFFARRAMAGVEEVEGLTLRRTIAWAHKGQPIHGWISARFVPEKNQVLVNASDSLSPLLGATLQRVRQALDLDADPERIDPVMAALPLPVIGGLRLPGAFDGFEMGVRVILGQQVTVKAARTLVQRLVHRFGQPIQTPFPGLTRVFPDAATLAAADPEVIGRLGIVRQRVRALQALASTVRSGEIVLHPGAPLQDTLDSLRALPGVGDWTAQVIAMRTLAWPDAWPASDIGLMNALLPSVPGIKPNRAQQARQITEQAQAWRPWRAYAVMRLWHFVETKE